METIPYFFVSDLITIFLFMQVWMIIGTLINYATYDFPHSVPLVKFILMAVLFPMMFCVWLISLCNDTYKAWLDDQGACDD